VSLSLTSEYIDFGDLKVLPGYNYIASEKRVVFDADQAEALEMLCELKNLQYEVVREDVISKEPQPATDVVNASETLSPPNKKQALCSSSSEDLTQEFNPKQKKKLAVLCVSSCEELSQESPKPQQKKTVRRQAK
jgi:hypothetical protein